MSKNIINIERFRKLYFLTFLIFASVIYLNFISGCESQKPLKIALSKGKGSEHYDNYSKWLKANQPNVECIDLYHIPLAQALKELENCGGLVLTGGPDVHPFKYGKADDSGRCEVDLKRDTLEFQLIRKAMELKIPILGVCRGQQILNVAFGGSLIVDIPEDYQSTVMHRMDNPDSCNHRINLIKNSNLFNACKSLSGMVNSNHHQAISQIADIFKVSARTEDGIIESVEWKDTTGKPFLMAVQWHPERMAPESSFSSPIAKVFLENVKKFVSNKN